MKQAQSPAILTQNPAISFEQLVSNITDPVILSELITTYEPYINTESKFQTASIVQILLVKMEALVTTQEQTGRQHTNCELSVKKLAGDSLDALAGAKALFASTNAGDAGTEIYMHTQKTVADFEDVNKKNRELLQYFMDDMFEESAISLKSFADKYGELNKLLAADSQQQNWVFKTMQEDVAQLKAYAQKLSLAPAKQAAVVAYQLLLPLYTETVNLYQLIIRKRELNPLIADSLLKDSGNLVLATEALTKQCNGFINQLYQYDQLLENLRNQLTCIGTIFGKADEIK